MIPSRVHRKIDRDLWAKLRRPEAGSEETHPLVCHCLDAGAVAEQLCGVVLSAVLRRRLAKQLSLSTSELSQWVAFWAACHDLGKATPVFQGRQDTVREQLKAVGYDFPPVADPLPHGVLTKAALEPILREDGAPWALERSLARIVATVIGGHHGVWPRADQVQGLKRHLGGTT